MARVELTDLGLTFTVRHDNHITLKEFLVGRIFRNFTRPPMQVRALHGIGLQVTKGERIGIIGHNGAGKSTLLKVLAGIYRPSEGSRVVQGRISSLFDIALGFEQEANGWENIRFRCYLQGETPTSVRRKLAEIANQYLRKGSQVYIEGSLKTRKWQDKDGQDRYTTEIVADEMKMLGSRQAGSTGGMADYDAPPAEHEPSSAPRSSKPAPASNGGGVSDMDDDIPF